MINMLKIKDNIKLEELEKFGFKEYIHTLDNSSWFWSKQDVMVDSKTKVIDMPTCSNLDYPPEYSLDIIYELTKADLVEKVDE